MLKITRNLAKLCKSLKMTQMMKINRFNFCKKNDYSENLKEIIQNEIYYEKEEAEKESSQEFNDSFLSKTSWKFSAPEDSTKITLEKTVDNKKITVVYSAKAPNYQNEEEIQENQENEEEMNESNYLEFMVLVDSLKGNQLVIELVTIDGEITVNNIFPTKMGEEYTKNKTLSFISAEYNGPLFESLDENLQDKMLGFLNSLGINEDLAVFIESTAVEHEQTLYVKWLENFKDFLSN